MTASETAPGAGDRPRIGVEEEFLLVDRGTGRPAPLIGKVIGAARDRAGDATQTELHRAQIETATEPCGTLGDLRAELVRLREAVAAAAADHGAAVVASGTFPGPIGPEGEAITPRARYEELAGANALVATEQLICGCHVHVEVDGPEAAIRVVNRIRRWLPVLLALSANSPYWGGRDSGFASFRTEVWARWPTAGPSGSFEDMDEYRAVVAALVDGGVILDPAMAYWDVRPSERYPTVEIRIADVGLTVDDAVLIGGLARALVRRSSRSEPEAGPDGYDGDPRPELLRGATWRAARTGLDGPLLDPATGRAVEAGEAVARLLEAVRPELEATGDRETVEDLVAGVLAGGNGAARQRAAFARRGRLEDVVALATVAPFPSAPSA